LLQIRLGDVPGWIAPGLNLGLGRKVLLPLDPGSILTREFSASLLQILGVFLRHLHCSPHPQQK